MAGGLLTSTLPHPCTEYDTCLQLQAGEGGRHLPEADVSRAAAVENALEVGGELDGVHILQEGGERGAL